MSYKIIHDAQNNVLCYGPNDSNYEPTIPDGCVLSISASIPLQNQIEQFSAIERSFDQHIDSVAAARGYGRVGISPSAACLGYAGYQNQWQAEAVKFGQWVSACWQYTIQEQQKVVAGTRTIPTPAEAVAELPPMAW